MLQLQCATLFRADVADLAREVTEIAKQTLAQPIAVYGALRSGTTMLRLMLDAHPQLACPNETDFVFDHLALRRDTFSYDIEALESDRIYREFRTAHGLPSDFTPTAFVDQIGGPDRNAVLILHRNLERVLDIYPNMRFIHLLRDPRDVARSSVGMGWAGTVYHGVEHWMATEGEWAHLKHRIAPEQVLQISYEDLVVGPERRLRDICSFCEVGYDPAMLNYSRNSTYSKPDRKLILRWKGNQSQREIELVETRIGALLETSGYEAAYTGARGPRASEKVALFLRNKRGVWIRRIERYGLRDPIIVAICSRLGMTSLSVRAQRRMEVKLQTYLK